MKYWIALVVTLLVIQASARELERIRVPSQMEFAGIKLRLTEAARAQIQEDVDKLRASEKYFNIKLDRVNLYFPIIEDIFQDESLPEDFKYLVIQESALISDAVSSANAVGFWQFKDVAAREVGLRIDRQLDERLNIVSATHGAAKYLKRQNFFFDNWVYALLAYNTGRGGAKSYIDEQNFGATRMKIDRNTHWYVKKFLAHKIAFENEIGGKHSEGLELITYLNGGDKSLNKIANEFEIDTELLAQYNKWLKKGSVPTEKPYAVMVPVESGKMPKKALAVEQKARPVSYPAIERDFTLNTTNIFVEVNGIEAVIANDRDQLATLAEKGGLAEDKFVKYNDLKAEDKILPGKTYFLAKKKGKATVFYHTVQPGETLWTISQKYGIQLTKLAKKNRMSFVDHVEPGRVLWLRKKRPKNLPIEFKRDEIQQPQNSLVNTTSRKGANPNIVEEVLALSPSAPLVRNEGPIEVPEYHVVKRGETLFAIGMTYGLTLRHLTRLNSMTEDTPLRIGQRLKLKGEYPIEELAAEEAYAEEPAKLAPKEEVRVKDEPSSAQFHVVSSGDTMYGIAAKYDVSLQSLLALNNMKASDPISVGQKIKIGGGVDSEIELVPIAQKVPEKQKGSGSPVPTPQAPVFHMVEEGDTMYGIARKYGLSLQELMELNEKQNTYLAIGEKLKVSR